MPRALILDPVVSPSSPPRGHGAEMAWRFGQENPPQGWAAEVRLCPTIPTLRAIVEEEMNSADPPRLFLCAFGNSWAHEDGLAAWTYARERGALAVVALGSNDPGSVTGPVRLPLDFVTVGADDPESPGEETGTGPGMWFEGHPFDSADFQSWGVPVVAAGLARAYEAVGPRTDRWSWALASLVEGIGGAAWAASAGFGLVTRTTETPINPAPQSPVIAVEYGGARGKILVRIARIGGAGVSLCVDGAEVLQTAFASAMLYLPAGSHTVEARAILPGGGATEPHAPGTATVAITQGYVPPAPTLEVQRVDEVLFVTAEAEGATSYAVTAQAGGETPAPVVDGEVAWPAYRPARITAEAVGAGGASEPVTALVPAVRSTAPLVVDRLHPRPILT